MRANEKGPEQLITRAFRFQRWNLKARGLGGMIGRVVEKGARMASDLARGFTESMGVGN